MTFRKHLPTIGTFLLLFSNPWNGPAEEALRPIPLSQMTIAGCSSAETNGGWTTEFCPATYAIDGDPTTFWHTKWIGGTADYPHWIALSLGQSRAVAGVDLTARRGSLNGTVKHARIFVGDAPGISGTPVKDVELSPEEVQTIRFPAVTGRYVTIVSIAAFTNVSAFAIAECRVLSAAPIGIDVQSPRPWQVVQRDAKNRANVRCAGTVDVEAHKVRVTLSGKPLAGRLPKTFTMAVESGRFEGAVVVPAGGWYAAKFEALDKRGKIVAAWTVERFGVGEVFVTAGQSNSTNCGERRTGSTSGLVAAFSGLCWVPADDPMPGPHDQSIYRGGSLWPSFGDAMATRLGVPVGIAVTGHGGTSSFQWQPGARDGLFAHTMTRIRQLGTNGFRCVLWHQGESDAGGHAAGYRDRMTNIIETCRREAGWSVPWSIACATFRPSPGEDAALRAGQQRLWQDRDVHPGPDTDRAPRELRDQNGKGIHFSPEGLKTVGAQWAELMIDAFRLKPEHGN